MSNILSQIARTFLIENVQLVISTILEATNKEVAELIGSSPNYVSRLTHRLFDNNILDRYRDGRSYRYFIPEKDQFRVFTYTFRVTGTSKKDRIGVHGWETDQTLDATIKGVVPINLTAQEVKDSIHEDLFNEARTIMTSKGILVQIKNDMTVGIADDEINTSDGEKGVMGVEFGETKKDYDPSVEIEVVYTNHEGSTYNKKDGMGATAQRKITEWFGKKEKDQDDN